MLESSWNKVSATLLKRDSNTVLSFEYYEIFKNIFFEEHLRTAAFK